MSANFTVVCVEDDDDTRLLFQHAVSGLGGTLVESSNVEDGLDAIRTHRPQLVLLDLGLHRRSGWKVAEGMRADADLRDIPIIVVTIRDQVEEAYLGQHVEWVQDFITKPFEIAGLEASIRKALNL